MKYLLLMGSLGLATALRFAQLLSQPTHVDAQAMRSSQVAVSGDVRNNVRNDVRNDAGNYVHPGSFPSTCSLTREMESNDVSPLQTLERQSAANIIGKVGLNALAADDLRMLLATVRQHADVMARHESTLRTDRQISQLARRLQSDADYLAEISTRLSKIYATLTPEQAEKFDAILRPTAGSSPALSPPLA